VLMMHGTHREGKNLMGQGTTKGECCTVTDSSLRFELTAGPVIALSEFQSIEIFELAAEDWGVVTFFCVT